MPVASQPFPPSGPVNPRSNRWLDRRLNRRLNRRSGRRAEAFSLVELMVVIGIIGILMAIGIPALRGLGESNAIDAATRQMLDDLAYARQRAINDRATVYMLFVPPNIEAQTTNLAPYRYTGYTLFSRRSMGEQPGRQSPRQLIAWRTLPDKTYFAVTKFLDPGAPLGTNVFERSMAWTNTFPLILTNRLYDDTDRLPMYYLAFNPQGQAVRFPERSSEIGTKRTGSCFKRPNLREWLTRDADPHPEQALQTQPHAGSSLSSRRR